MVTNPISGEVCSSFLIYVRSAWHSPLHVSLIPISFSSTPQFFYLAIATGAHNSNTARVKLFRWVKFYVSSIFVFALLFGCVWYGGNGLWEKCLQLLYVTYFYIQPNAGEWKMIYQGKTFSTKNTSPWKHFPSYPMHPLFMLRVFL